MAGLGRIPRSRGGVCGVLLILLGLWAGLSPFVGPYIHFGYTPDKAWAYNSGRLYLSIVPGAVALIGGLLAVATRNRGVGVVGGVFGVLGGGWLVVGSQIVTIVLKQTSILPGSPIIWGTSAERTYLETVALFTGVGCLLIFVGALTAGRFSLIGANDVQAADQYYDDYSVPSPSPAPDVSQEGFPTSAGQFQTSQFPDPQPYSATPVYPATVTPDSPTTTAPTPAFRPAGRFTPGQGGAGPGGAADQTRPAG
jgi:hypothetical protein